MDASVVNNPKTASKNNEHTINILKKKYANLFNRQ